MQSREILALLLAGLLCSCEPATTLTGSATVTDGDSLRIGVTRIRLHGIDAPEGRQSCTRDGRAWPCGAAATAKLKQLVGRQPITCTQTDIDAYGRTVARCSNGTLDLGAEMVLAGLALAYREYGPDYVSEEAQARAAGRGVWAGEFTPPWDWRSNPDPVAGSAPAAPASSDAGGDCPIKGNTNRRGERIYHVPGSGSYEQTRIDTARGERWFCSEQQALGAGWRAPRG